MNSLFEYINGSSLVNEAGRPRKAAAAGLEPGDAGDKVVMNGKVVPKGKLNRFERKGEMKNGTDGLFAVDPPTDKDFEWDMDIANATTSKRQLNLKLKTGEPFFIIGHAGWGKTSVIQQMAKKYGLTIVTVYLDKAEATDLGGIPVPNKADGGGIKQTLAMPAWAAYIWEHPDEDFLLFFDEMNQAAPDVQNALMPIVEKNMICNLQFNNIVIGAAGNYSEENQAVSDMSGPLESRFAPIIEWEDNTPKAWKMAFEYLHKQWDDIFGKEIMQEVEDSVSVFVNPREIDAKVLKWAYQMGVAGTSPDECAPEDIMVRLDRLDREAKGVDRDSSRSDEKARKEIKAKLSKRLCDWILNYGKSNDQTTSAPVSGRRAGAKAAGLIPAEVIQFLRTALGRGYSVDENGTRWGVTWDNIVDCCDMPDDGKMTAEQLEYLKNNADKLQIKVKYPHNSDLPSNLKPYSES